ncbi:stalk domain-containing protein [Cohnella sp. AR92]|uniref:stalk domain-containing protein n=1 Tax=Cohnella sp. AR92 TaxID=648716 RepID=UPI000F8D07A4|nr:stalk domain-containing protein [Cohnella sp. AR92]RUS48840.1 copper amine oxidase N-terminal domain-containing protein [Cohnella sp. AR92]
MRRKSLASMILAILLSISLVGGEAGAADAPDTASGAIGGDIAKMYRVNHTLTLNLKGSTATLDGKALQSDKPIIKNGRVYITLRTLWLSGAAASVAWNSKKREALIAMKPEVKEWSTELGFRVGSDQLWLNGEPLGYTKIPAPFLSGGRVYIPIQALSQMGVTASTAQGQTTLRWSDKIVELKQPSWTTDQDTATFSLLYETTMFAPQVMVSMGAGVGGGGTGLLKEENISMDGRVYKRMEYTIGVRPGVNLLQVYSPSGAVNDFTVYREPNDAKPAEIRLTDDGMQYLSVTAPTSGYVEAKAGEAIPVSGALLRDNPSFDKLTLTLEKYEPSGRGLAHQIYVKAGSVEVAIKDGKFAGSIAANDGPGYYLLSIISPKYIPYTETGPGSTKWAEMVVKVEE